MGFFKFETVLRFDFMVGFCCCWYWLVFLGVFNCTGIEALRLFS